MEQTLYWQVIPNVVAVVVHTDSPPTDADWDTCIKDITQHIRNLKGILIYAASAGPSASQRARTVESFKTNDAEDVLMVIMSGSRLVRGIVTAFSWTMSSNLKVFSTHDFEGAIKCFGMPNDDELRARLILKQLARSAKVQIDAFADESGQFQQRFKKD